MGPFSFQEASDSILHTRVLGKHMEVEPCTIYARNSFPKPSIDIYVDFSYWLPWVPFIRYVLSFFIGGCYGYGL